MENGDRPLITVIIPAYNEAGLIENTLAKVATYLTEGEDRWEWELLVVDDGSTDGTGDLADAFAADDLRVRVLHHRVNFNLGQALRYAFGESRGDYVVTLDADLSYSPGHIGRIVKELDKTRAKVVLASPYARGGSVLGVPGSRLAASKAANRFLSVTAKGDLSTVTGMTRGYDGVFIRSLNLKAMDVEINSEIIYKAQVLRARIVEIPATLHWDPDRDSSFAFSRSVAAYAFSGFLFRPFAFFIIPGLVALAGALVLWLWLVLASGDDTYRAVLAATATVVGVQLVALGLLSVQSKRYFEEMFHLGTTIHRANLGEITEPR